MVCDTRALSQLLALIQKTQVIVFVVLFIVICFLTIHTGNFKISVDNLTVTTTDVLLQELISNWGYSICQPELYVPKIIKTLMWPFLLDVDADAAIGFTSLTVDSVAVNVSYQSWVVYLLVEVG